MCHRKVPTLKQRIAGRSLPIEKFAINKAERYLQGEAIPLCGLVCADNLSDVATCLYRRMVNSYSLYLGVTMHA